MDANKINCKQCKKNNGFWAHIFRATRDIDKEDIGKFLMITSVIVVFILSMIKLSALMSLIDVLLIACCILFFIGFALVIFFY